MLLLGFVAAHAAVAQVGVWTNRFNGASNSLDFAQALAVDRDGNVFVTGYSGTVRLQEITSFGGLFGRRCSALDQSLQRIGQLHG